MTAEALELTDIDLSDVAFWARRTAIRHEAFALLRAQPQPLFFAEPEFGLVLPSGPGYYALVRHADVVEASSNPAVFSSVPSAISIADLPPEFNEFFGSMINMDDPRHAHLRKIVSRAFTPRMLEKVDSDIRLHAARIVDELLAAGPGGNFVEQVSQRLPLAVIGDMMGIPEDRRQGIIDSLNYVQNATMDLREGDDLSALAEVSLTFGLQLAELFATIEADKRARPTDDLISALVTANVDGESLTGQELVAFFILIAVAGNETTRNSLSHALKIFTDNPGQRDLLLDDIDGRLPGAVEEIVRYVSPVIQMRRTLTRDYDLNGLPLSKGDKVLLFYWSANRDEAVFAEPGSFDITREPNRHIGFGAPGPHYCLGAHLARRQIATMLHELFTRVPQIRAVGKPRRGASNFLNVVTHQECTF